MNRAAGEPPVEMPLSRRDLLAGIAAGTATLAGCMDLPFGGKNTPSATPNPPDGPVANAPIPPTPGTHVYATMGAQEAPAVTYFGNWKCPFCAEFATGESDKDLVSMPDIVSEYVSQGKLRLRYRALAYTPDGDAFLGSDAPRAARAGLAVWNVDPESYWAYHEHVMANQPPENQQWATTDRLVRFARVAGVSNVGQVRSAIEDGQYEQPVQANTRAATDAGIQGTPELVFDGRTASPFDAQQARDLLETAVGGGASPTGTQTSDGGSGGNQSG